MRGAVPRGCMHAHAAGAAAPQSCAQQAQRSGGLGAQRVEGARTLVAHAVMPGVKLQEHAGNDKAWVWSTVDFAEEAQKVELFAIRFGSVESKWREQQGRAGVRARLAARVSGQRSTQLAAHQCMQSGRARARARAFPPRCSQRTQTSAARTPHPAAWLCAPPAAEAQEFKTKFEEAQATNATLISAPAVKTVRACRVLGRGWRKGGNVMRLGQASSLGTGPLAAGAGELGTLLCKP